MSLLLFASNQERAGRKMAGEVENRMKSSGIAVCFTFHGAHSSIQRSLLSLCRRSFGKHRFIQAQRRLIRRRASNAARLQFNLDMCRRPTVKRQTVAANKPEWDGSWAMSTDTRSRRRNAFIRVSKNRAVNRRSLFLWSNLESKLLLCIWETFLLIESCFLPVDAFHVGDSVGYNRI